MADNYISKIITPFGERLIKAAAVTSGLLSSLASSLSSTFKTRQTAKTDPTAAGNSITFIDSIVQDENGDITATKKTIYDASQSQKGLMSAEDKTKLNSLLVPILVNATYENGAWVLDDTFANISAKIFAGYNVQVKLINGVNNFHLLRLKSITTSLMVFSTFNAFFDVSNNLYSGVFQLSVTSADVVTLVSDTQRFDATLNNTSTNAVQNKVIYAAIGNVETLLAAL